jgi:hypothetical protein
MQQVRRYLEDQELYRRIVEEGLKTALSYNIHKACVSELQFFESLRPQAGAKTSPIHATEMLVS